jgi:ABC-type nitrate/sulfonate/bicarbonate transport system permease component
MSEKRKIMIPATIPAIAAGVRAIVVIVAVCLVEFSCGGGGKVVLRMEGRDFEWRNFIYVRATRQ